MKQYIALIPLQEYSDLSLICIMSKYSQMFG